MLDAIVDAIGKPYFRDDAVVIYHADCRDILPEMPKVDLVLTDPPYGIDYNSGHDGVLSRSIVGDENTALRDWLLRTWAGPALVFGTWKIAPPPQARQILIWDTMGALGMGALDLPWKPSHQQIYVIGKGFSGKRSSDVLRFPPCQSSAWRGRLHPHEKPLALLKELVSKAPDAQTILDPFMGSGTMLRAAKDLGRLAIGIEIEEKYCEIAAKRMAQGVLL